MTKCNINDLADLITKELEEYSQEVTDELKKEVKTVAKECRNEIKLKSPQSSGKYKKGWTTKIEYDGKEDIRITVHNKKYYQLTHLLEFGHVNFKGGSTQGIPHIRPAEQKAAEKLLKKVKVVVKR